MGYGFMAYRVDIDKLKEVCGGKDEKLRRMICGRFKADLSQLDSSFDYAIEGGAPNTKTAISQLIHGEEKDSRYGFMYAYGFKLICEHFGRFLRNDHLMPIGVSWIEEVDAGLKAGGVTSFSLSDFSYGGAPVSFPRPDDFPGCGHMTAAQVLTAQAELNAFKAEGIDPQVLDSIDNLKTWMNEAAANKQGIVAFFH